MKALALVIFPSLTALACNFIFGGLFKSGLASSLEHECHSSSQYLLPYTGFSVLNSGLCKLVTFFHEAMATEASMDYLAYFVGTGSFLVTIPVVEASRSSGSILAFYLIWGISGQIASLGVTTAVYWLFFALSEGNRHNRVRGSMIISQAHAEAVTFGIVIGVAVPSIGMLILNDPYVTALWQIYPIYIYVAQAAHLFFRPASQHPQSGYRTIQVFYILSFILSSSLHFSTLWPLMNDMESLKTYFLPSLSPITTTSGAKVLDFLKWDYTFSIISTIMGTLWFAQSLEQILRLCAWYLLALPIFGPGAAVMGVALWRESVLHSEVPKKDATVKN